MKVAVICLVHNEERLLPYFLSHYLDQVDTVFLIDGESTDDTLRIAARYPRVEVSTLRTGGKMDNQLMHDAKLEKRLECVGKYDYVIYVDTDEFVVPKSGRTLRAELETPPHDDLYGTDGFDMVRRPEDPPLSPYRPLMEQFRWGAQNYEWLSKTIILRPESAARHHPGMHLLSNIPDAPYKDPTRTRFYLLHYRAIDEELYVQRHLDKARRRSPNDLARGFAIHCISEDEAVYRERFQAEVTSPNIRQVI